VKRLLTRAILLGRRASGESNQILTLFTEARGVIVAIARGILRSKKRFAGGLQTFSVYEVTIEERAGSDLAAVGEATLVEANAGAVADLGRLDRATHVLRIVRALLPRNQPEPALFDDLVRTLRAVSMGESGSDDVARFELRALSGAGLEPALDRCAVCGKPVPEGRSARFDPDRGGVVCRTDGGGPMGLSAGALRLLASEGAAGTTDRDSAAARAALDAFLERQTGSSLAK